MLTQAELVELLAAVARGDAAAFEQLYGATRAKLYGVLLRILGNRAIDIVRKKGELSIEDEPDALNVAAETPPPLARREMTEELKKLLSCLGKLDPEKQRIVLLAYYSGWSRDQLAKKLDIPVNTIKTWLRRSLLEIRACMGT
jgi:RNA polymerase sigma-70 factor (ECF subfamily)